MVGLGGLDHLEAQLREQRVPEGEQLVHVQPHGDTDAPPPALAGGICAQHPPLFFVQVGQGRLAAAGHLLAAVAGDEAPGRGVARAVEAYDCQHAVVLAALAAGVGGLLGKALQFPGGQYGALVPGRVPRAPQRHAVGPHQPGDVGAHHVPADLPLEGPEHGVVEERAPLHHDALAQLGGVGGADDLVQRVLHDGDGQPGGDVLQGRAVLLGLLHRGIHEHGAAGAQVHRMPGQQAPTGEFIHGQAPRRLGEGLYEGAAARGAGLVQEDVVDGVILYFEALDVLAADVDDEIHPRLQLPGGDQVGHGLHHAAVQPEGGPDQRLAVAGGAGPGHGGVRVFGVEFPQEIPHGGQGIALVGHVGGLEQVEVLVHGHGLDGGGAGVDADVHPAVVAGAGDGLHPGPGVAVPEGFVFLPAFEQRRAGGVAGPARAAAHAADHVLEVRLALGLQGRAHGHRVQRVRRVDAPDAQRLVEAVPKLGEEGQRAAQVHHVSGDLPPLGKTGDGLPRHGLEDAAGDVLLASALVQQGLDVRLGEHAAAAGDGIAALVVPGEGLQLLHGHVHQGGHLVDERAGAAGAGAVHAHLEPARAGQEQYLRVLAAQLHGHVGLGRHLAKGHAGGVDLLEKVDVQLLRQAHARRAGYAQLKALAGKFRGDGVQQHLAEHGDLGPMALVAAEHDFARLVEHHGLDRRRSDVQSNPHRSSPGASPLVIVSLTTI